MYFFSSKMCFGLWLEFPLVFWAFASCPVLCLMKLDVHGSLLLCKIYTYFPPTLGSWWKSVGSHPCSFSLLLFKMKMMGLMLCEQLSWDCDDHAHHHHHHHVTFEVVTCGVFSLQSHYKKVTLWVEFCCSNEDCGDKTELFLQSVYYEHGNYSGCDGMSKLDERLQQVEVVTTSVHQGLGFVKQIECSPKIVQNLWASWALWTCELLRQIDLFWFSVLYNILVWSLVGKIDLFFGVCCNRVLVKQIASFICLCLTM
jgi:hypothetical protein